LLTTFLKEDSVTRKQLGTLAGGLLAAALTLSGCQATGQDDPDTPNTAATTVTVAVDQAPDAYNSFTAAANSVYNAWVDNATQGAFVRVTPEGTLVHDEEFGHFEKISDDPLIVEYTFADAAQWSDGVPLDCDDALLLWAALSGTFGDPALDEDEDGKPDNIFTAAASNGFDQIKLPTCAAGDKTFSVEYTANYADWESIFMTFVPAHVAAEQGGFSVDGNGQALIDAIKAADVDALKPVAEFWSSGWQYQQDLPKLPDLSLIPASGYYKYDNAKDGTLTLVKNDTWWGTPANIDTVVFKYIDAAELVKAMENGEVDIFQPSAVDQDTVAQLEAITNIASFEVGSSWTYSHIDLDHHAGAVFESLAVRQAFLKCVPRQELVDKFVKTVDDEGVILNSHEFFPGQPEYDQLLRDAPTATKYDELDLEGAQALLAEAGYTTPVDVRIMRAQQSDLRGQQVQLVKASCDQAGFNIIDTPDAEWGAKLEQPGAWDAVLFAWAGSGLLLPAEAQFITGGDQNFGAYSNATVDALWKEITQVTDPDDATPLKIEAEEAMWADPYNVILYANPGLQAHANVLEGTVYNPTQYGPTWNINQWTLPA
jgi:peptide/nickel transport system substrate-binding protein